MAAITLAEAKNNTSSAFNPFVIDEFRKSTALLDLMPFEQEVNPNAGGGTLDFSYRRLTTQATAGFRKLNTEYVDQNVTTDRFDGTLAVLGGSFAVDRVIANLGAAASGAIELNMTQKVKAGATKFQESVILGDTAVEVDGFDGLDKALTGSTTELGLDAICDWTDFDTDSRAAFKVLDLLDEFLASLDGTPTIIAGNKFALARVRAAARRASMYVKDPVADLLGANGRPIERETYGGIILVDLGEKSGSSEMIVPVETRTVDGVEETGLTDLYAIRLGLDGFHGITTIGGNLVEVRMPNFADAGAVKRGEVEFGPVGVALKATKAAAVLRNIKVR